MAWPAYDTTGTSLVRRDLAPDLDPSLNAKFPTYPVYRPEGPGTITRLPNVRPSVLYIFGGQSNLSPPNLRQEKMTITGTGVGGSGGANAGRVKEVVGEPYGHLIPLEAPLFCARAAAEWASSEVERWWVAEREYEEWTRKPMVEKSRMSEEYMRHIGVPNGGRGRDKAKI
ncbi:hypothetical protein G7046_g10063 [Stylonectria norvegica]|nr:hypothetical protein G7046_g10063 [Stylonectria norvegica]